MQQGTRFDHGPGVIGPETLTPREADDLQSLANKYSAPIIVVGSRAEGRGRNIDSDLPVGKGNGTRSDTDVSIDGQVELDTYGAFESYLSFGDDVARTVGGGGVANVPFKRNESAIANRVISFSGRKGRSG